MTDTHVPAEDSAQRTFTWHPTYRGRTAESVERELENQIRSDQRQYELALSGAENSEHQALASVMELEKRWSVYTFDWTDTPADDLARRVVSFELERDLRQEMIPYGQYRSGAGPSDAPRDGRRARMTDAQRRRVANIGAGIIMVLILLVAIFLVGAIL